MPHFDQVCQSSFKVYREQSGGNMGTGTNGATGAVAMTIGGRSNNDSNPLNANVAGLRIENTRLGADRVQAAPRLGTAY